MGLFFRKHKFITFLIIVAVLGGGYYGYKKITTKPAVTRYVLGAVTRETIVATVPGTGQTSASNQVDIKSKASGDLLTLKAVAGQEVKTGDVIATLNARDALKTVRDAQSSLTNAKLSLEKLQRGSRPEELISSKNQIEIAKQNLSDAKDDLVTVTSQAEKDLADANTNLSDTYSDTKNILQDIYNKVDDTINRQISAMFSYNGSDIYKINFLTSDSSAENDANWQRLTARDALKKMKDIMVSYPTTNDGIDNALNQFNDQLSIVQSFYLRLNDAVNAGIVSSNLSQSTLDGYKSSVNSARSGVITSLNSIATQKKSIYDQKLAIVNQGITNNNNILAANKKIKSAQDSIVSAENDYKLKNIAADPLDIKSQQASISQATNQLIDAQEKLSDYTVKAPFDGVIASVAVKKSDSVSASTVIATLITKQKIATISLNEVDVAKIKVGQKVTLTFDAISDLSLSGTVAEIDAIGTVTQGVVNYNVKIGFDTQDERVKPGMSVSASIITEVRTDVLAVPNSAIKQNSEIYAEMIDDAVESTAGEQGVSSVAGPRRQTLAIGLANDSVTEIIFGLNEGDKVVTKTITPTAAKATAPSATSLLGGGAGGAGGAARGLRGN